MVDWMAPMVLRSVGCWADWSAGLMVMRGDSLAYHLVVLSVESSVVHLAGRWAY